MSTQLGVIIFAIGGAAPEGIPRLRNEAAIIAAISNAKHGIIIAQICPADNPELLGTINCL